MSATLADGTLPLPLWRRGKVREVYAVGEERLLLVASDRISAFDVVLPDPIPHKGAVLTQLSAHWFHRLSHIVPTHFLTADVDAIVVEVPALAPHRDELAGRSTLVRRTAPVAFECVVRGQLAGSAWQEYAARGTLAGEPLPAGLRHGDRLEPPVFSPATKATSGHDENVSYAQMEAALGGTLAAALRDLSLALFAAARHDAAACGLVLADTKFEFGLDVMGHPTLIDEVLTPDSSRFWLADEASPGDLPRSLDKQPVRDWLAGERQAGRWNGEPPGPRLPPEVIAATTARYLEAYRRLTGHPLPGAGL